jgi:hypothetical protein
MSLVLLTAVKASNAIQAGVEALGGPQPMIANPFPGVPNFTVFGASFTTWWQKLFAGAWAVGIVVAGFYLIVGLVAMAKADANNPHAHAEGKKKAAGAGIGLICLAALGVILPAILFLAT